MMNFNDIKQYLPKYLSEESYEKLIEALNQFPNGLENRFYAYSISDDLLQGDIINEMPIYDIKKMDIKKPDIKIKNAACMIFSNSCDISLDNKRKFSQPNILYAPIFNLENYKSILLKNGISEESLKSHIDSIKSQKNSSIVYLPKYSDQLDESLVFLDKINSISYKYVDKEKIKKDRILSLQMTSFYLLLFKLSVHICRFQEGIDRDKQI